MCSISAVLGRSCRRLGPSWARPSPVRGRLGRLQKAILGSFFGYLVQGLYSFLMLAHSVFRYTFEVFSSGAFVDAWVGDDATIAKSCKKHWFLRCDLLPRLRRPPCEGSKCGSTRVARLALKTCRKQPTEVRNDRILGRNGARNRPRRVPGKCRSEGRRRVEAKSAPKRHRTAAESLQECSWRPQGPPQKEVVRARRGLHADRGAK